jgi:DNA replication and repair protein RecF
LVKNKNTIVKTKHLKHGPHRASIDFYFNKQSESYLSRGEQKKASIVFWMLQVLLLVEKEKIPVVLIDDISSELDEIKIKSIVDFLIETNTQIFMTDIGNKELPLNDKKANRFLIENGVITSL